MKIARRSVLLGLAARALAQQTPSFSSEIKVVSLLATVHDKDGRAVRNLTADDFALLDDGVVQKIRYFSQETSLPLIIGLLVDTSRSQTGVLDQERRASYAFLDQVLREGQDRAFVAHFDERAEIVQGLTSSKSDLERALRQLKIPGHFATLIYSAIRDCSEKLMKKQPGRKAFILLTDGVAFRDKTSIGTAIEFAQRADTILYSIRFSDPIRVYRPVRAAALSAARARGREALARMAKETGGASFEVSKGQTIEAIYEQIQEALRSQYNIGYTPEPSSGAGVYHKLKLTANDRTLVVRSREGYYAK